MRVDFIDYNKVNKYFKMFQNWSIELQLYTFIETKIKLELLFMVKFTKKFKMVVTIKL